MSEFEILRSAPGRCKISHMRAKAEIITDLPPEFGGEGRSFSSTDLVSAALGSCIMTSIDTIIADWGYDPDKLQVIVQKYLGLRPKVIEKIEVEINYTGKVNRFLEQQIIEAVTDCPVKLSLSDEIDVELRVTAVCE